MYTIFVFINQILYNLYLLLYSEKDKSKQKEARFSLGTYLGKGDRVVKVFSLYCDYLLDLPSQPKSKL